jgi:uncharacterized membrane protein YdjX (TVP38/TMEM64 family)
MVKKDSPDFYVALLGIGFLVTLGAYFWFARSPYFEPFSLWTQSNLVLFYVFLFFVKAIGLIWPPLPGGVFTLGAIPLIGWSNAYLIDFAATAVASSGAYWLGKRYGMTLVEKITGKGMIEKIQKINIKKERELEAVFLLRLLGGGVVVEVVSYASGLFRISYKSFILGSLLSHLVYGIPYYFLFGNLFSGKNIMMSIVLATILVTLYLKFKNRYLA